MEAIQEKLRDICPSIIDIQERGKELLIVLPQLSDSIEDLMFKAVGDNVHLVTPEGFLELGGKYDYRNN